MDDVQPSSVYRGKAAELRAAADKTSNFSVRVELLDAAERYEELAEYADRSWPSEPH